MALKGLQAAAIREGPQPDSGVPAASQHGLVDGRERRAPDTSAMALQRQRLHQVRQPPDLQSTGLLGACCVTAKSSKNSLGQLSEHLAWGHMHKSAAFAALLCGDPSATGHSSFGKCALQIRPLCITVPALTGSQTGLPDLCERRAPLLCGPGTRCR